MRILSNSPGYESLSSAQPTEAGWGDPGEIQPDAHQVNIHQAKTNLSKLIKKVINGEEVIIAKGNIPLVKMVGLKPQKSLRKIGSARDSVKLATDFDEPLDDFKEYLK